MPDMARTPKRQLFLLMLCNYMRSLEKQIHILEHTTALGIIVNKLFYENFNTNFMENMKSYQKFFWTSSKPSIY